MMTWSLVQTTPTKGTVEEKHSKADHFYKQTDFSRAVWEVQFDTFACVICNLIVLSPDMWGMASYSVRLRKQQHVFT